MTDQPDNPVPPCGHKSIGHNDGPCCAVCELGDRLAAARAETALLWETVREIDRLLSPALRGIGGIHGPDESRAMQLLNNIVSGDTATAALSYQREVEERVRRETLEEAVKVAADHQPPSFMDDESYSLVRSGVYNAARDIATKLRALADAPRETTE